MNWKKWAAILLSVCIVMPIFPTAWAAEPAETAIYNYLTKTMGLNTAAACGILANIQCESDFIADVIEHGYTWDSGGGYGICQWTNYPRTAPTGRRTNLVNYCNQNGYDYRTLQGQLHYLEYELKKDYSETWNYLKSAANTADGAYNAGYYWCYYFEMPKDYPSVSITRGNLAKNTYWAAYQTNGFSDVLANAYYAKAVKWAVDNGITSGSSAVTFSPDSGCTRGQIMVMLWRAMGSPEPSRTWNPFVDVKENDYYYKAILWAVQKRIAAGTSVTTFSPNDICTRAQAMSFLWNAKHKPTASKSILFTDVNIKDYYYNAVKWAVQNNITSGTSMYTFSPDKMCTRAEIVTFIYKAMA